MSEEVKNIFVYNPLPQKPSINMAINKYYFESVKNDVNDLVLRVYSHTPGIILGKNQSLKDINLEACIQNNLEVVRRPTGGSFVYVDPSATLCYSLFLSKKIVNHKDIHEIYKMVIDPLHQRLGDEFEIEGNYCLRLKKSRHNGASMSLAGHSMVTSDGACQFDGIINLSRLDAELISNVAHLRKLCYDGKEKFVEMNGKYFNLQGRDYSPVNGVQVIDYEKDLIKKMPALSDVQMDKEEFIWLLKDAVKSFSPNLKAEDLADFDKYKKYIPENIQDAVDVNKNARGHCFIDFLEPDVRKR